MNCSEGDRVPELGGYYIKGKIVADETDILLFMRKYNLVLDIHINTIVHICNNIISINRLMFYINLLNFNGYSSWKMKIIGRHDPVGLTKWKKIFKKGNSNIISLPPLPNFDKFNLDIYFSIYRDI
jgi:hypothetical protein